MADDLESHENMLRLGLKQKGCSDELRAKLLAALALRQAGSRAENEDELIIEVENLIDRHPF